jgi:hypothetical protein
MAKRAGEVEQGKVCDALRWLRRAFRLSGTSPAIKKFRSRKRAEEYFCRACAANEIPLGEKMTTRHPLRKTKNTVVLYSNYIIKIPRCKETFQKSIVFLLPINLLCFVKLPTEDLCAKKRKQPRFDTKSTP